ncbi:hypothetical protein [Streptomyces sp. NPDC021608]|uniref:hypothetical protein n=1 Tax=Streptomyces sp. NPDC021608 TaxID=3154903 RepID=UPI00340591C2
MITFSFEPRADDVSWSPDWRPDSPARLLLRPPGGDRQPHDGAARSEAELTWDELRRLAATARAQAFRLITAAHPELRDHAWLRGTVGAGAPPAA